MHMSAKAKLAAAVCALVSVLAVGVAIGQSRSQWRPVAGDDASVTFIDQNRLTHEKDEASAWTMRIYDRVQHQPGEISYLYSVAHERFYCDDGRVETLGITFYDKNHQVVSTAGWSEPQDAPPESIADMEIGGVCQNMYLTDIAFLDFPAAQKYAHDAVLKADKAETPSKKECAKKHDKLDGCPKPRPWYLPPKL
jgi:hypothetical protein